MKVKHLLLVLFLSFAFSAVQAQSVKGISVNAKDHLVVVCLNGKQICEPSTSCFISNLNYGTYLIQVYNAPYGRVDWDEVLYDEKVTYRGHDVKYIPVAVRPSHNRPGYSYRERAMSDEAFSAFMKTLDQTTFSSDKVKLIETQASMAHFTSNQCRTIVKEMTYSSDKVKVLKLLYPSVVDKDAFFTVLDVLTFSSDKQKVMDFAKEYNSKYGCR